VLIAYLDRGSILKVTSTCFVRMPGSGAAILTHVFPGREKLRVLIRTVIQSHVLACEQLAVLTHRADLDADATG
jgi:hypothetical protein